MQSTFRCLLAFLLALPYVAFAVQDTTITQLIRSPGRAPIMKVEDLADDFRAVRLVMKASGAPSDMMSTSMPMMLVGMPGMVNPGGLPPNDLVRFFELMDLHWTAGETVKVGSAEYLVTYRLSVTYASLMMALAGRSGAAPGGPPAEPDEPAPVAPLIDLSLKLGFMRVDEIQQIHPIDELDNKEVGQLFDRIAKGVASGPPLAAGTMTSPGVAQPVLGDQPRSASPQTIQLDRGKQMAIAVLLYATDHDDVIPYVQSFRGIAYTVLPYAREQEIFQSVHPSGGEWRMNMSLAGVLSTRVEDPARTPLFYESKPWPDGRRVVAFLDGSTRWVDAATWERLQPKLKLRHPRVGRPLPANLGISPRGG